MNPQFWHERWRENRIGFHLDEVNPRLVEHWPALELPVPARVLVPLCGKSVDMAWLRERGHDVVGVELSPIAVEAFFAEQQLLPRCEVTGDLVIWRAPGIEIYCGDFFAIDTERLGRLDALYDRAALIALPAEMRPRYVEHLARLLPTGAPGLLLTLDYHQASMAGPPFAVPDAEVNALAAAQWQVMPLGPPREALDDNPRFAESGLASAREQAWRMERLGSPPAG
ncbi:MAG: thiopurine S-methyltransferase [Gammaproteobacteria bacterium]|nr:thiopurine S-methyltransferase [Gammaproteobacteria bacterium]TVQ49842.1 MAG: thiopurine S-methyltransferase [Gammaproteobacteria bacterium]